MFGAQSNRRLSYLILSFWLAWVAAPLLAYAAEFVTLDAFSGHPGSVIQVSGGGMDGGEMVSISMGATPVVTVIARDEGSFGPVSITIPVTAPMGAISISAAGERSGRKAVNAFFVNPFAPNFLIDSTSNTPFSPATLKGEGFAPNETVSVNFAGTIVNVTADAGGNFALPTTIPSATPQTYAVTARGNLSEALGTAYFYIGGFYPSLTPSTYFVMPGEIVSFSGSGFGAGEKISVGEGAIVYSVMNADAAGVFQNAGAVTIPFDLPIGRHSFTLTGANSGASASVDITVGQFLAEATPSKYFGLPGDRISFSGWGFSGGEMVSVFDGTEKLATFQTDPDGTFTNLGEIRLPLRSDGASKTYHVVGERSGASSTVTVSVGQFNAQLLPSKYFVKSGETMSLSGLGFLPGETVRITGDGGIDRTALVDAGGNFASPEFQVPFGLPGAFHLTATGASSGISIPIAVPIGSYFPSVTASSYYLHPGDHISFTGFGFAPGEAVRVMNGSTTLATLTADAAGALPANDFTIPFGSTGAAGYHFTGLSSGGSADIQVTHAGFSVWTSADTYYSLPGSTVHVMGHGFAPGESVHAKLGTFGGSAAADSKGDAGPIAVPIPFGIPSPAVIELSGLSSGATGSVPITLGTFYPGLTASTYYTAPGSSLTLSGTGFSPGETVTISAPGRDAATVTADTNGTFTTSLLQIPVSAAGGITWTATGDHSNQPVSLTVGLASFNGAVSPSTYFAKPGSPVIFNGTGFLPGEHVSIVMGSTTAGTVTIDANGSFTSDPVTLPFGGTTAHFSFNSDMTHQTAGVDVTLASFYPGVALSSYYGVGGSPEIIDGSGFAANEPVVIQFGDAALSTAADGSGAFHLETTVPFAPAGTKAVTATGGNSGAAATTEFTYAQVWTSLQLGSYAGAPSSTVTFIGSGYLPNEPMEVSSDRSTPIYRFAADAAGSFNDSGYIIPGDFLEGPLTFTAKGLHSFDEKSIIYYVTGQ